MPVLDSNRTSGTENSHNIEERCLKESKKCKNKKKRRKKGFGGGGLWLFMHQMLLADVTADAKFSDAVSGSPAGSRLPPFSGKRDLEADDLASATAAIRHSRNKWRPQQEERPRVIASVMSRSTINRLLL